MKSAPAAGSGAKENGRACTVPGVSMRSALPFRLLAMPGSAETGVAPVVNQVELHPLLPQPELVAFCRAHGIQTVAYSPLTKGRKLDEPVLADIASRRAATPAQVLLAWGLAQGHVILPKSTNPQRIAPPILPWDSRAN